MARHTWVASPEELVMQAIVSTSPSALSELLSESEFRSELLRFVAGKVGAADIDDVVQSTLAAALAAPSPPPDRESLRRWVFGIARHKVADHFRRAIREVPSDGRDARESAAESTPLSARDLLRWVEKELPPGEHAERSLEWALREASGEKLETIADEEQVPAPRIRQRVSRLRRHFRERWALHAAMVVTLVAVVAGYLLSRTAPDAPPDIAREVPSVVAPSPEQRGRELRKLALEACDQKRWEPCLRGLDEARALDSNGDETDPVRRARAAAGRALAPVVPSAAPAPSTSAAPARPVPTSMSKPKAKPKFVPKKTAVPLDSDWSSGK